MNKLLLGVIALGSLVSCNQNKLNYAVISGKVKTTEKTLKLIQNQELLKEIEIKKDGSFRDTIRNINDKNYFFLAIDRASVLPLFLQGGTNITLNIDNNINNTEVSGSDDAENTKYLIFKNKFITDNLKQKQEFFFAMEPSEFKEKITSELNKLKEKLKDYNIDNNFEELENKWVEFQTFYLLKNYQPIHANLIPIQNGIKLPKDFFKGIDEIDYDNSLYFNNIEPYRALVLEHYLNDFIEKIQNGENLKKDFEKFNKIKSKSIKENFASIFVQFISQGSDNNELFYNFIIKNSKDKKVIDSTKKIFEATKKRNPGTLAPTFNYENYNGGTISLESLKGKAVYIDIWATWCGPCRGEIPALKELEKQFHNKINFVSISIDEDKNAWKQFVKQENLSGYQLFGGPQANILEDYMVTGIPRFILIDKNGKIISANAPRPSSKEISELLKTVSE